MSAFFRLLPLLFLFFFCGVCFSQFNQAPPIRNAKDLADRSEMLVGPVYPWQYAQGTGPYSASTVTLTNRRRAFFPGESVALNFQVPSSAK
jgi:hypothetical protein